MGYFYDRLTSLQQKEVDKLVEKQLYIDYGLNLVDLADALIDSYREYFTNNLYGIFGNTIRYKKHEKFISRMELLIQDILTHDIEIKYEFDKQFRQYDKVSKLKFDFVLENGLIIEYDGEQHFHELFDFKYKYGYDYQHGLSNDNLKNIFCLENNVPLLRIPYGLYHTCSKQTRRQLRYLIMYFNQMKLVTDEIIAFYSENSESNYVEIAKKQNEIIKRARNQERILA